MRLKSTTLLFGLLLASTTWAFDIAKLANNKETTSKYLKEAHLEKIAIWVSKLGSREKILPTAKSALAKAVNEIAKLEARCDVNMDALLVDATKALGLADNDSDYLVYLAFLRTENVIDDIYFRILSESHRLAKLIENAGGNYPLRPINTINDVNRDVEVEKLYKEFKEFPDEVSRCSLGNYMSIAASFPWKTRAARDRQLKRLDYLALNSGVITLEIHNKLEAIRENGGLDWPVYTNRYLDVVANAKDKLATAPSAASPFATKYAERKEKLTQRARLYKQFDSTQVMILSDLIQKQAKRMDARNVSITWRYTDEQDSEIDVYVLSPLERYRLSIKMLRRDMAEAMRSELFKGTSIEYEDLVVAAYETGLIKAEELEQILKFEELWNPKVEKWRSYANFAFQIAGSASFFLPPPWNIVGALALVITQSAVMTEKPQADADDNWNVII